MAALLDERIRTYYLNDRDCPFGYEPSGQDFLSPCLAEADVMRRVLPSDRYAAWLTAFLPAIPKTASLPGWHPSWSPIPAIRSWHTWMDST